MCEVTEQDLENGEDWLGVLEADPKDMDVLAQAFTHYGDLTKLGKKEMADKVLADLDLLRDAGGCVPSSYTEELDQAIIRKFRTYYRLALTLACKKAGIHSMSFDIVVEPSWEDASTIVIIAADKHVILNFLSKAWNLHFDNVADLVSELDEDSSHLVMGIRELPGVKS